LTFFQGDGRGRVLPKTISEEQFLNSLKKDIEDNNKITITIGCDEKMGMSAMAINFSKIVDTIFEANAKKGLKKRIDVNFKRC
jgi:hypothetical protein